MDYKIAYKALAERDIWEIADYLSDHSMPAAEKFLHDVKNSVEKLATMPLMYPKIVSHKDYRKIAVGDYVVLYIIDELAKEVLIMRVVHGKRNYQGNI